jgi:Flp pilus assembly protein TadD
LWTTLGAALADQGRLADAEEAYGRAIALDAKDAVARNGRALVWLARGKVDEARREFVKLTEEFPSFAEAENNLAAIAIGYRDWSEVETRARRALRRGESAAAWNNLGVALDEQGRDEEAQVAYGRALAADPRYWQARLNLAS